jgi:signal transduction histidine kinase
MGGARPVKLTAEDLTRLLVNLVKNAVEAMPAGGRIQISLGDSAAGGADTLALTVEDNGPGIPAADLEKIFAAGYTAHVPASPGWPASHRGLGLTIVRSLVEAAGGRIRASNRPHGGARFEIELPVARNSA